MILHETGYLTKENGTWKYFYYLKDHVGSNRLVLDDQGGVVQINNFYPYGLTQAEPTPRTDQAEQPYKFGGKELDRDFGVDVYDFEARMYNPAIGRFMQPDPLAEKYYSISSYAYCANNPVNAIDPDGRLVIFINGMHAGSGGSGKYWEGFDKTVMQHLDDYNPLYRDSSLGGVLALPDNLQVSNREYIGEVTGMKEAENIIKLISDKDGNIKETIKIISHSMGGAYAKGYVKALMEYLKKNNLSTNLIEFEADFAPFQPINQKAVDGVDTYQFSHSKDWVAGNKRIEGAQYMDTSKDSKQEHGINTFFNQIQNLPEGKYKIVDGKIVPY